MEEIGSSPSAPAAAKTVSASTVGSIPAKTTAPKDVVPKAAPAQLVHKPFLLQCQVKYLKSTVQIGDLVKRGDVICVLEAMKMENEIMATQNGKISDVRVTVGQLVSTGDVLVVTA